MNEAMTSVRETVAALVAEVVENTLGVPTTPARDEPLLSSGLLDSLALSDLLGRLTARLGLEIDPLEVTLENFDTVARIESYALEKLGNG